ncbi:MAG: hypothetical protein IRZ08_22100 [Frankia sp.]|nr:hypothetical protein [Frankia sp.]
MIGKRAAGGSGSVPGIGRPAGCPTGAGAAGSRCAGGLATGRGPVLADLPGVPGSGRGRPNSRSDGGSSSGIPVTAITEAHGHNRSQPRQISNSFG